MAGDWGGHGFELGSDKIVDNCICFVQRCENMFQIDWVWYCLSILRQFISSSSLINHCISFLCCVIIILLLPIIIIYIIHSEICLTEANSQPHDQTPEINVISDSHPTQLRGAVIGRGANRMKWTRNECRHYHIVPRVH